MSKQTRPQRPARYTAISPRLVVVDAPAAIDFYVKVFGAEETLRVADPSGGKIVCSELVIDGCMISLAEEDRQWNTLGPKALGGTPVALTLNVDDVDAVAARAIEAGARIIFPINDQFYGWRQGRIEDPFGHQWILSTFLEDLTAEQMETRMATWWDEQTEKKD
jgi:PhnB protein